VWGDRPFHGTLEKTSSPSHSPFPFPWIYLSAVPSSSIAASKERLYDCRREAPLFIQHVPADISAMNGTIGDTKHGDELAAAQDAAPLPSPKPTSSNPGVEDLTTRALKFLSTASTETIGGIAVGLAACTYLILGRVGLVLIGAVGGVVLHATWEGQSSTAGSIQDARRETGLEIVKRILDLREARRACEVDEDDKDVTENSFDGFQPETAAALNNLVDAVIRDYVKWWYSPILPVTNLFHYPMPRAPYFTGREHEAMLPARSRLSISKEISC
jgi:hypothetical protein